MTSTIRTLGRQVGLTIDVLGPPDYRSIHEKDYEIVAPVLQFTRDFLVEGGATLTVAFLENLARHLVSSGSKKNRERNAFLELVVTHGKHAKRVTYRGPIEGLSSVVDIAQA
jgi:hypothetical protein